MKMSSKPTKLRKYIVTNAFCNNLPQRSNFEIVEESITTLKTGEFLVKALYISVDPYMRSFARERVVPYEQFGFQVGKIIDTKNTEYPVHTYVVAHSGWSDYTILNGEPDDMFNIKPYAPQNGNLPLSLSIGALGMPGITAYLGLLEICKPKTGEVVCVTSAAGAVGSLVGQIAKLKGCTVVGFSGSDKKVKTLLQELGFDYAFNYKTAKVEECLQSVNGIDCYFDNVGGELSEKIIKCMNEHGRVAVCGSISTYARDSFKFERLEMPVSVRIESFSFTQWEWSQQCEALNQLREWVQNGIVKAKETVTNGFEKLPDTFVGMLNGENIGKAIVKV